MAKRRQPSMTLLERWLAKGVAWATDGCKVEPDGQCRHGHESWLIVLGLV